MMHIAESPIGKKTGKTSPFFYEGEGSENRPFRILCPWPTSLMLRSEIWKGLFSDLSPFSIHSLGLLACQGNRFKI
jgi:hypothetical protein